MMKYIEPLYFFIALFIGMFLTYISTPLPKIIIKYPTPDIADQLVFRDPAENCYKYNTTEINCPSDSSKIMTFPTQHFELPVGTEGID